VALGVILTTQRDSAARYGSALVSDFSVMVIATATIEPTHLVEISSELSGALKSVHADCNDVVNVGTVLAELDTIMLEAQLAVPQAGLAFAVARVAVVRATLDEAQDKYDTALNLEERGITAHQTFVSQRAAFMRAQAKEPSAIADRTLAQANLHLQQAELENACICSPIRGVVLERAVDAGWSCPVLVLVSSEQCLL
jgi:HlyD family secretion protein